MTAGPATSHQTAPSCRSANRPAGTHECPADPCYRGAGHGPTGTPSRGRSQRPGAPTPSPSASPHSRLVAPEAGLQGLALAAPALAGVGAAVAGVLAERQVAHVAHGRAGRMEAPAPAGPGRPAKRPARRDLCQRRSRFPHRWELALVGVDVYQEADELLCLLAN